MPVIKTTKSFASVLSALALLCLATTATPAVAQGASDQVFSYYADGRICVSKADRVDGKPLITPPRDGQADFKPSWSKTGNRLVFFRRIENNPDVMKWKTQIHIVKADGSGLRQLTDGHTDFNPTWTRDGKNTVLFNRKNLETGDFIAMATKADARPGQEVALADPERHHWVHSSLTDGRLLIEADHPTQGWGYYLLTPDLKGGKPKYERIDDGGMLAKGLMLRISVSPDETKVCFEHMIGYKFKEPNHAIYIADFDVAQRKLSNHQAIANKDYGDGWFAYPRWTKDADAVIYHADTTGKGRLYLYRLKDGKTAQVSQRDDVDYRYPHVRGTPK